MERRELLATVGGALGATSLGGCLGTVREVGDGAGDEPTTDDGDAGGERPAVADTAFELLDHSCGQRTNEATVHFRDGSVVVEGTVPGSNGCYVAKLDDASHDPETGTLTVTVASMKKEGTDACTQCIVEIDYEATVTFEGGLPETVEVVHEAFGTAETITTAESK